MKKVLTLFGLAAFACAPLAVMAQEQGRLDTAKIEQALGAKGTMFADEGVFKMTFPRSDVPVSVDGRLMEPFLGFTSWAAFKPGIAAKCMVMGDVVLFEDEVSAVMDALLDAGLQVTALHNHFFYDEPKAYFMHIGGESSEEQLAGGVRKALDAVKAIRAKRPEPTKTFGLASVPTKNAISAQSIDEILGVKGQAKDGMYKAVIGRTVRMTCGCEVGKEMGVNTWAALGGTDDAALIDGDFAVLETELQTVLKALRKAGIHVVAIHHHMVGESPRMLFLHYWGVGKAVDLARGVKAALDAQASAGKSGSQ
jgi:phosphotransferase system IIB component